MFVEGGSGQGPERDIYSLDSLISWLETKRPSGRYNYELSCECLLAQYFTAMGISHALVGETSFIHSGGPRRKLPEHFDFISAGKYDHNFNDLSKRDWTYGKALGRARQVAGKSTTVQSISSIERGVLGRLAAVFGL